MKKILMILLALVAGFGTCVFAQNSDLGNSRSYDWWEVSGVFSRKGIEIFLDNEGGITIRNNNGEVILEGSFQIDHQYDGDGCSEGGRRVVCNDSHGKKLTFHLTYTFDDSIIGISKFNSTSITFIENTLLPFTNNKELPFECSVVSRHAIKTNITTTPNIENLFLNATKCLGFCDHLIVSSAKALKGNKQPFEETIIDRANGYIYFKNGENEETSLVESCYWKMNNGKLLLAIALNGIGQDDTTLQFFVFDKTHSTLKAIEKPFSLGLGNKAASVRYQLPRRGKTIKALTYDLATNDGDAYRWNITWNGSSFDVVDVISQ